MSVGAARIAMRAIAKYSTDANARELAAEALEALLDVVEVDGSRLVEDDPAPANETAEERKKRLARNRQAKYAAGKKRRPADASSVSVADAPASSADALADAADAAADGASAAPRARTPDPDLSGSSLEDPEIQDFQRSSNRGGVGDHRDERLTLTPDGADADADASASARRGPPARKKPVTHCPGPEESLEVLDAWCRVQKIPPASQVPAVMKMVRWHQKNGKPRASWLATWHDWRDGNGEAPRVVPTVSGNPNPVSREFELTPFDEARIAAARADREQEGRADVASTRPESTPVAAFGGKR